MSAQGIHLSVAAQYIWKYPSPEIKSNEEYVRADGACGLRELQPRRAAVGRRVTARKLGCGGRLFVKAANRPHRPMGFLC
jgi:hypothetical protein